VIPPQADASFVAAMEDVLDVYQRPHDPARPVVCLDETSKQLLKETRAPIAMRKGQPRRVDYEYERNGTASVFMIFAPLEGRRDAIVTERHTAIDYAHALKHVADEMFPRAEKIVLVQDNLNTHKPASLYQAFAPQEARRLTERFEWHYTPMGWTPHQRHQCAKVAVVEDCDDRRGVHAKGYHHRARSGEEHFSGAWGAPRWFGGVPQENIARQAVVFFRLGPEVCCCNGSLRERASLGSAHRRTRT